VTTEGRNQTMQGDGLEETQAVSASELLDAGSPPPHLGRFSDPDDLRDMDWDDEPAQQPIPGPPVPVHSPGRIRRARLRVLRVEPWSVMKTAFMLSIALGITFLVAVATLWSVIDAAGVFDDVGDLLSDVTGSPTSEGFVLDDYVGFSRVMGLATMLAVLDVVLITALATLGAFLYNLASALLGGLEVVLAEDE
jgi:hypothetical protein